MTAYPQAFDEVAMLLRTLNAMDPRTKQAAVARDALTSLAAALAALSAGRERSETSNSLMQRDALVRIGGRKANGSEGFHMVGDEKHPDECPGCWAWWGLFGTVKPTQDDLDALPEWGVVVSRDDAAVNEARDEVIAQMRREHSHHGLPGTSCHGCGLLSLYDAALAAVVPEEPACEHEWVDAANEVIISGRFCKRCGLLAPAVPEEPAGDT